MNIRTRLRRLELARFGGGGRGGTFPGDSGRGLTALLEHERTHPREPLTRATVDAWQREGRRGLVGLLNPEDFED